MIHRRPRVGRTLPVTPWAPMTRPPAAEVFNEGFASPFSDQACAQEQEKRQVVAPLRADHPEVRTATRGSAITALATAASPRRRLAATRELRNIIFAKTTQRPRSAKLATGERLAALAGHPRGTFNAQVIRDVMGPSSRGSTAPRLRT